VQKHAKHMIFICGNNDLHPIPIKANVLLQAILFRVESNYDHEADGIGFYNYNLLREKCGRLVFLSGNSDEEYVTLVH
jgi:hypothetical protein